MSGNGLDSGTMILYTKRKTRKEGNPKVGTEDILIVRQTNPDAVSLQP